MPLELKCTKSFLNIDNDWGHASINITPSPRVARFSRYPLIWSILFQMSALLPRSGILLSAMWAVGQWYCTSLIRASYCLITSSADRFSESLPPHWRTTHVGWLLLGNIWGTRDLISGISAPAYVCVVLLIPSLLRRPPRPRVSEVPITYVVGGGDVWGRCAAGRTTRAVRRGLSSWTALLYVRGLA